MALAYVNSRPFLGSTIIGATRMDQLRSNLASLQLPLTADLLAVDAIQRMEHNQRKPISVLPVVNGAGQLQGLLRLHDLVQVGLA